MKHARKIEPLQLSFLDVLFRDPSRDITTKHGKKITPSQLSLLAMRFRDTESTIKKNRLFLEICEKYMPRINKDLRTIQPHNYDEYLQIYHIEVLNALRAWKMTSNFETYLYCYLRAIKPKFMKNIKIIDDREVECILTSDVDSYEAPLYDPLQEYY